MRRRQYLALSSTALAALAAGCTGGSDDETPDDDSNGEEPATDEPDDDDSNGDEPTEEHLASFREALEGEGYEVIDLSEDDGVVTLDYTSDAGDNDAVVEEAEPIMGAFADELDAGWGVDWLEVWLFHDDGSENASYAVLADWVSDWAAGELSDEEFFDRVRDEITQR